MKKQHTKLSMLLLAVFMSLGLMGCQSDADTSSGTATSIETETVADSAPSSQELVTLMGNGINLGNTMEAYGHADLGTQADISAYETYWGQPVTTQEMISAMKEAGFDTLRVPVAWTNAMDFEDGDYTIRTEYLDRVEEIINYALAADMYVIVNDHWDGGWWGMFGSATQETRDQAMELYTSMWTQIGERFKDYSDKLIFESGNEEIGNRLNDTDIAADSGSLSEDECYEVANTINQTFVDTIRSTGSNNSSRFLLIAGYNTDIEMTCDDRFIMPTDSASDKLLISVHYYNPSGYCINTSLSSWGSDKNYQEQNDYLAMMTKFTDQGYGVVIGEYAVALNEDGSVKENTTDFFENFLNNCDLYNYCPVLWDCSSLFIRTDLSFKDSKVAWLYKSRSYENQSSYTQDEIKAQAQEDIDTALAAAIEASANDESKLADDESVAWLMFNSSDWSTLYSVGDIYEPNAKTEGIVATDVPITGEGSYTVSLDFTGTASGYANGIIFSALAVANGETLFPGYLLSITGIQVNGEDVPLIADGYTTSDDGLCTRYNIYNEWVTAIPDEARTAGSLDDLSSIIIDPSAMTQIQTITVSFDYAPGE